MKRVLNKRAFKGLLAALLVSVMIIPVAIADSHTSLVSKSINVDSGVNLSLDGLPYKPLNTTGQLADLFIYNGTTYLPARALSEALGVDIAWRGDSATVAIGRDEAADAAKYLSHYFGLGDLGQTVTWSSFNNALDAIGASAVEGKVDAALVPMPQAVKAIVQAAQMDELALTYPADKTAAALRAYRVTGISADYAPYVATALDTGLLPRSVELSGTLDGKTASVLLMNAADAIGNGRYYLGYTSDSDIYAKVIGAWNSFTLLDEEALDEIGRGVVEEKATTGYLLTYSGYNPRFLPQYTIVYDHSNIKHANQLIGLLASEGITARVALQPKKSVYEYNLAWGPIRPPTPTYRVEEVAEDFYLANTVGYMLTFEFLSAADKAAFDPILVEFAKKSGDNVDAIGVIAGSYWQPQYSSKTPMPADGRDGYVRLDDVSVTSSGYMLNTFILPELTDTLVDAIEDINDELTVEVNDVWANAAFNRFLTGEARD